MAANLLKKYNETLDFLYPKEMENQKSFRKVFDRDFIQSGDNKFNGFLVKPRPNDKMDAIEQLYWHLTTKITDEKNKSRSFDNERTIRIHWIRFHLSNDLPENFIYRDLNENRIYIIDKNEKYVIILDTSRDNSAYYLITAYKLGSSSFTKIMKRFKRSGELL